MAAHRRIWPSRVKLDRGEPAFDLLESSFGGQIGVEIDVGSVARFRIEVGVGAQRLVDASAEQRVHGLPEPFAGEIPASHLERARRRHDGDVGTLREPSAVAATPERLDVHRIVTDEELIGEILDRRCHHPRSERRTVGLTPTDRAVVGGDLHQGEVGAAERRRRIRNCERLDLCDPHESPP